MMSCVILFPLKWWRFHRRWGVPLEKWHSMARRLVARPSHFQGVCLLLGPAPKSSVLSLVPQRRGVILGIASQFRLDLLPSLHPLNICWAYEVTGWP